MTATAPRCAKTAYNPAIEVGSAGGSRPLPLVCVECGETSDDGEGRRAELAVTLLDEEWDGPDEVAVFCPECWSREFSDA